MEVRIKTNVRINYDITAPLIRLIGEGGKQLGIVSRDQALFLAYEKSLDLIQVGLANEVPVCKLMDYGKLLYEKSKAIQKNKARQKASEIKEIKLSINISSHDLQFKEKQAEEFFSRGDRVLVFMVLRGREMIFKDKAYELINKFKTDLGAGFEQDLKGQGNRFSALLKK